MIRARAQQVGRRKVDQAGQPKGLVALQQCDWLEGVYRTAVQSFQRLSGRGLGEEAGHGRGGAGGASKLTLKLTPSTASLPCPERLKPDEYYITAGASAGLTNQVFAIIDGTS